MSERNRKGWHALASSRLCRCASPLWLFLVLVLSSLLPAVAVAQGGGLRMPQAQDQNAGGAAAQPGTAAPLIGPDAQPLPGWLSAPAPVTAPSTRGRDVPPDQTGRLDRIAAVVNTEIITANELARRLSIARNELTRRGVPMPTEADLQRQVLDRMVVERAQMQLARETGLRVDDATVDRAMARVASENSLSMAQLRDQLKAEGMGWDQARDEMRRELTASRLREREVDSKIQVSDAEIDAFLAEQAKQKPVDEYLLAQILLRVPQDASPELIVQQRERANALIGQLRGGADFTSLAQQASESTDASNGGLLGWRTADRLPETFVNAVSGLSPGQVTGPVRSGNGFHVVKLLDKRSSSPLKMGGPVMQTRVRQILIRPTEVVSESEARRRLLDIRQRVIAGTADFAEMARQYSVDGSAGRGGELGWIYPGDTVPEFERAMNALQPNQISEPVASPFGLHLIQVEERRTDEASPDRMRQGARNFLRERKSEEAYVDWLRELRDRTFVEVRTE